ncbi:MAG: DUF768 domain-containing protein [Bauldia sp.]|nr:DUF768 domain-containing protein [Bauldia sp.]
MSKRFQRWVETWIEENVNPHSNTDIESDDARAERLTEQLFAEAAAAGFTTLEIDEERKPIPRLVRAAVTEAVEFDADAYKLKSSLAMENEDGD